MDGVIAPLIISFHIWVFPIPHFSLRWSGAQNLRNVAGPVSDVFRSEFNASSTASPGPIDGIDAGVSGIDARPPDKKSFIFVSKGDSLFGAALLLMLSSLSGS